jgi:hypothetical protein
MVYGLYVLSPAKPGLFVTVIRKMRLPLANFCLPLIRVSTIGVPAAL